MELTFHHHHQADRAYHSAHRHADYFHLPDQLISCQQQFLDYYYFFN